MPTIIFIRHARSSWEDESLSDEERPLSERGLLEAKYMEETLNVLGVNPKKIFVSHTLRAQQTAQILFKNSPKLEEIIKIDKEIYSAFHSHYFTKEKALEYLRHKLKSEKNLCVVGHDDGFSEIIGFLLGEDVLEMPTCSIVKIKTEDMNLSEGCAQLKLFAHNKKFINKLTKSEK